MKRAGDLLLAVFREVRTRGRLPSGDLANKLVGIELFEGLEGFANGVEALFRSNELFDLSSEEHDEDLDVERLGKTHSIETSVDY